MLVCSLKKTNAGSLSDHNLESFHYYIHLEQTINICNPKKVTKRLYHFGIWIYHELEKHFFNRILIKKFKVEKKILCGSFFISSVVLLSKHGVYIF